VSLQIRYNRVTTARGVDPDHILARAGVTFSMAAEEGAVAMSEIVVDDDGQTLDYVGLRRVYAFETTAPAQNQLIFDGYIADKTIGRLPTEGPDDDPSVLGRRWTLQLADVNSVLSRRIITGADGVRPAETDVARINWLLSSSDKYLSNTRDTWDYPSAYVSSASPVNMDAADVRGQTAFDVLNDCAQASGKNWFVRYNEQNDTYPPTNGGALQLWYDFDTSSTFRSTARLTNVRADVDNVTTFAVFPDAQLTRDANRVYSGIYITYDGGSLYQQSTNVANLFQQRDAAVSAPNVKSSAKASARATRYLADATTEDDRITCSYLVPKQYVNSIREGQSFQAKFTHLPGWDTGYNYMRVLRRSVTAYPGEEFYLIRLELSPITTPAAPTYYTGEAFAAILRSSHDGSNLLYYDFTGDTPASGWYAEPSTGPIAVTQGASPYTSITTSANMILRVEMLAFADGVGGPPVTVNLKMNSTVIASETYTPPGGFWNHDFYFNLNDVDAPSGAVFSFTSTAADWTNVTVNNTYLRVGRGDFWWNSHTIEWIGP
jgi:hypothetical protein